MKHFNCVTKKVINLSRNWYISTDYSSLVIYTIITSEIIIGDGKGDEFLNMDRSSKHFKLGLAVLGAGGETPFQFTNIWNIEQLYQFQQIPRKFMYKKIKIHINLHML